MNTSYTVRLLLFDDGERFPVLVRTATGEPVFDATVYSASFIRPRSGSEATVEQALRGVQFLLGFVDERGIDLDERVSTGRFLDPHEIDALIAAAYKRTRMKATDATAPTKGRNRSQSSRVSSSTAAMRLLYARTYLNWLGRRAAGRLATSIERRQAYVSRLDEFLGELQARTPSGRSKDRLSMTKEQADALAKVTDPESPENPWKDAFVRVRNRLYIEWAIGTGLRRGELLGITIRKINFTKNTVEIVRRAGDPKDPRRRQPRTKTLAREVAISPALARLTHEFLLEHRRHLPEAKKHGFLFVAEDGRPLSESSVTKMFHVLRERCGAVGADLSSHVLRHTWNETFSEIADEMGMPEEEERRARTHSMGWTKMSRMPDEYLKRRSRRLADDMSRKVQERVMGRKKDDQA